GDLLPHERFGHAHQMLSMKLVSMASTVDTNLVAASEARWKADSLASWSSWLTPESESRSAATVETLALAVDCDATALAVAEPRVPRARMPSSMKVRVPPPATFWSRSASSALTPPLPAEPSPTAAVGTRSGLAAMVGSTAKFVAAPATPVGATNSAWPVVP